MLVMVIAMAGCSYSNNFPLFQKKKTVKAAPPDFRLNNSNPDGSPKQATGQRAKPNLNQGDDTRQTSFTMDAMVGQVNGRPIYASEVLKPNEEDYIRLGKRLRKDLFRIEATKIIRDRIKDIVFTTLLIGESEGDLNENERFGLNQMMTRRREELIRKHGKGSITIADATLKEKTGKSLEETLATARQVTMVNRYLRKKLLPEIHVSRKDIENYYRDHPEKFNTAGARELRVIRATKKTDTTRIAAKLKEGLPFEEVAKDKGNTLYRSAGGLMSGKHPGNSVFKDDAVNQAMVKLKQGERSPKVVVKRGDAEEYWWVYIESLSEAKSVTLRESQTKIRDLLRTQQYQRLSMAYREEVFANGSYNSVDQMVKDLVEVAVSRYAQHAQ